MYRLILCQILFFYLFEATTVNGQTGLPVNPYEPYEFQHIKPIWYHTLKMDATINDSCDGYNSLFKNFSVPSILYKDHLYTTMTARTPSDHFTGAYLEKRDIHTGALVWENHFNIFEDSLTNRQEAIKQLVISDEVIESYNIKRFAPYPSRDPYLMRDLCEDTRLVKRVYDNHNGRQLYYLNTNLDDTTTAHIQTKLFLGIGQTKLHKIDDNRIECNSLNLFNNYKDYTLIKYYIDSSGRRTSAVDSFIYPNPNGWDNFKRLDEDHYIAVSPSKKDVTIFMLDRHFNIVSQATSAHFDTLTAVRVQAMSNKYIVFNYNYGTIFDPIYEVVKMDLNANILSRAKYETEARYSEQLIFLDYSINEHFYLCTHRIFYDDKGIYNISFVILKSNEIGTFDIVNQELQKNKLKWASPFVDAVLLPNGNYILGFQEVRFISNNNNFVERDGNAKAFSLACFTPEMLGIKMPVSLADVKNEMLVTIYPNPVDDYINIDLDDVYTGLIKVIDVKGKVCRQLEVINSNFVGIESASLASGLYFIQFFKGGRQSYTTKVVKL